MTTYEKPTERPTSGQFLGYDHLTFWVGNAKQAASYYITRFGFEEIGYKGLETGSRNQSSRAVRLANIVFVFVTSLECDERYFN